MVIITTLKQYLVLMEEDGKYVQYLFSNSTIRENNNTNKVIIIHNVFLQEDYI